MIHNKLILSVLLIFSFSFSQEADLITQKISLENAMRDKVDYTLSRQLDPTQYIIVVNARLDFKPLSLNSNNTSKTNKYESSSYTFIPVVFPFTCIKSNCLKLMMVALSAVP